MTFVWTNTAIETLKTKWASGLSAAEISKDLGGISRAAVIGKVFRLGLSKSREARRTARHHKKAVPIREAEVLKIERARNIPWSEERVRQLTTMFEDGWSFGRIAAALGHGITRNAVIGKVKRVGLRRSDIPTIGLDGMANRIRRTKKRREDAYRDGTSLPDPVVIGVPLHLQFAELTHATCEWAFGDSAPYSFCGNETIPGRPYCAGHWRAAHSREPNYLDRLAAQKARGKQRMHFGWVTA